MVLGDNGKRVQIVRDMPGKGDVGLNLVKVISEAFVGTINGLGLLHALQRTEVTLRLLLQYVYFQATDTRPSPEWYEEAEAQLNEYIKFMQMIERARAKSEGMTDSRSDAEASAVDKVT